MAKNKNIGIKELTAEQKKKADHIVSLLRELKNSGVHPIVIDGGGGSGLQFVRCKKEDLWEFGEIVLSSDIEARRELDYYIYTPEKSCDVVIDTLVP